MGVAFHADCRVAYISFSKFQIDLSRVLLQWANTMKWGWGAAGQFHTNHYMLFTLASSWCLCLQECRKVYCQFLTQVHAMFCCCLCNEKTRTLENGLTSTGCSLIPWESYYLMKKELGIWYWTYGLPFFHLIGWNKSKESR